MNIMSDAEYKEFRKNQDQLLLESLQELPLDDLKTRTTDLQVFVDGQIEYGEFDHDDMYGPAGHVRTLSIYKQALREARSRLVRFENGRWIDLNGKPVQL